MPPVRDRIVDAAARLFGADGIRGVGVDTIIAAAGVAKATFYAHFRSKDELVLAYLGRSDEVWRDALRRAADAAGPDPRARLVGLFDALRQACARAGFRGCPFINTAAESRPGSVVHDATVAHKRVVRAWVTELATEAAAADPAGLGAALTVLLDGGLAVTALEGAMPTVDRVRAAAAALVDAACAPGDAVFGAVSPRVGQAARRGSWDGRRAASGRARRG
jgi:AcrR family transcriptional regulator